MQISCTIWNIYIKDQCTNYYIRLINVITITAVTTTMTITTMIILNVHHSHMHKENFTFAKIWTNWIKLVWWNAVAGINQMKCFQNFRGEAWALNLVLLCIESPEAWHHKFSRYLGVTSNCSRTFCGLSIQDISLCYLHGYTYTHSSTLSFLGLWSWGKHTSWWVGWTTQMFAREETYCSR
jgi:hypothetical protein